MKDILQLKDFILQDLLMLLVSHYCCHSTDFTETTCVNWACTIKHTS